jgi:6-pyruvoyltetrahydropterin/6-carboxytetrahydropterin synthase
MIAEITKEFTFEAAHNLPEVGPGHKCHRVHGHLFRVEVHVAGEVDPTMGWVLDFGDLAAAARRVVGDLDHRFLNDLPGLANPTSENLARYFYDRLAALVPGVAAVTVHESPSSRCTWRPTRPAPAPAEVTVSATGLAFSAAHFLLLNGGAREPIHGHDYRMTVAAGVSTGSGGAVEGLLVQAARRAVQDLEHKVLIAGRPVAGSLEVAGDRVRTTFPGGVLDLPAFDCAILDIPNTATEELAGVVARRIAADPALRDAGARRVRVTLLEGIDATASVEVAVEG